ncbi:hypothetical protein UFOVP1282_4 [uncultured Caudovirales phage]|uniref:Uncharacterized protein n=1 Tax=uncultured Caudovirales phage TaxID=2100421 RepID=A0A6J5RKH9_9CAUD|nr:hypothetical protein UFOVP888_5 [uncultured Caudovirales phage]CAB4194717.1 hypothetical protein UFOVP1282_4 [uncultured Caudovirales phage]
MKATRTLATLAAGFAVGLFLGSTSQAIRLALAEKTTPLQTGPVEVPKFLKDTTDDTPNSGSQDGDA